MCANCRRNRRRQRLLLPYVEREVVRHHGQNAMHIVRTRLIETAKSGDDKANQFWSQVYASLRHRSCPP